MVDNPRTRRRFVWLTGTAAMAGLAGCSGNGGGDGGANGGGDTGDTETQAPTATDSGDGLPAEYVTATSIGGNERNPERLSSKEAVSYQEEPNEGQQCSNCRFYIEDKNGDGLGACSIVEGTIAPEAYCVSYVEYEA
ncbi:high-potential iron-sulfur protein [Haloferax larsenii]|uniref:High potential iron-sulfur protein n=1 Tax=Haloferax larsenii TaxID=302484 RepID=A0A1H7PXX4_HALLR|nr:high-potential iron-sulfur protein [Haloferax larsenii]SEL40115.1 High potential iron-sulfur protein [Haloferax larsenii]